MDDVCPKCDLCGTDLYPGLSHARDGVACAIIRAAYQRGRRDGIDEGVAIARASIVVREYHCDYSCGDTEIDWTDVDAAAEKAKGE